MKALLAFLAKEETDGDDLAIIITGCAVLASFAILFLMATGN